MHLQTGQQFQLLNMFSWGALQRPLRNHIPLNFFAPTADLLCAFAPESAANLLVPPQLAPCCSLLLSLLVSWFSSLSVLVFLSPFLCSLRVRMPAPACLESMVVYIATGKRPDPLECQGKNMQSVHSFSWMHCAQSLKLMLPMTLRGWGVSCATWTRSPRQSLALWARDKKGEKRDKKRVIGIHHFQVPMWANVDTCRHFQRIWGLAVLGLDVFSFFVYMCACIYIYIYL